MNVALNLGSVAIALIILWLNIRPWWKGGRDPKALLPYASGAGLGSLSTVCVGGILGWIAVRVAGLSSSAGTKGVGAATGVEGGASLPIGRMGSLTPEGAVITVVLLAGVVLLHKTSGKQDKRRIVGGFVTFAILGWLPGVAALLRWWPTTVNEAGAQTFALLSSGVGL